MCTLDCENFCSSLESVAKIFRITPTEIIDFYLSKDYSKNYLHNGLFQFTPFDEYISDAFISSFSIQLPIKRICWFHLSCSICPEMYKQKGLLPLDDALKVIFPTMTIQKHNFERQGPFGMLIKDVAFKAEEIGNHDYLNVPEIIEDMGFADIYKKNAIPVIVKFQTKREYDEKYYLRYVLNYIYSMVTEKKLSMDCNTCYDGKNQYISPSNIIYVEQFPMDV